MLIIIRNIGFVILLVYVWHVLCNKDENEEESEKTVTESENFIATKEWQVVKKGQPIPPGLHVRINLESGVTEAKLLDKDEEQDTNAVTQVEEKDIKNILMNSKLFKPSELKEALKNIKGDDIINPDDLKLLTKKFRKYDEIKEDLGELNLIPKTDAELLIDIMEQLKSSEKENQEHILRLLEDLDFLVHQIDNAVEFAKRNGFPDIVYKNLNSSDPKIRRESLKLFSSLVQNNPKAKVEALETSGISILLKVLSLDPDDTVKFRATTALSCLLRRFPYAQLKFVENGGLTVITKLFDSMNIKIKVKLATLMSDLLDESREVEGDDDQSHPKKQYESVNLESLLLEHNWCENLKKLLEILIVTDPEGHDSIEKCLLAIKSIIPKCGSIFEEEVFKKLGKQYTVLSEMDGSKDEEISNTSYFMDLSKICTDIMQHIPKKKTEL